MNTLLSVCKVELRMCGNPYGLTVPDIAIIPTVFVFAL